jgi:hypothetical protein
MIYYHSSFFLEYAIRKVQENQVEMKLNGAHQFLAYADNMNLLGDNIDTINKNTETSVDASKEVGVEINIDKTKAKNAGQNWDIKIGNFGNYSNKSKFDSGGN